MILTLFTTGPCDCYGRSLIIAIFLWTFLTLHLLTPESKRLTLFVCIFPNILQFFLCFRRLNLERKFPAHSLFNFFSPIFFSALASTCVILGQIIRFRSSFSFHFEKPFFFHTDRFNIVITFFDCNCIVGQVLD